MSSIFKRSWTKIAVTLGFWGFFAIASYAQTGTTAPASFGDTTSSSTTPAQTTPPPAGAPAEPAKTTDTSTATTTPPASESQTPSDKTPDDDDAPPPQNLPALHAMPVPGDAAAHKPPAPTSGKPQIGLQFPPHKQLEWLLRMNQPSAIARIQSAELKAKRKLVGAGMDPNINIDDAMALAKPVINIYCKRSVGDNIIAHGFKLEAFLCQYQRKPSGRIDLVRFVRIGESEEVYSGADFEDKAVMLVDTYLSAREHQLRGTAKKKPVVKGKKGK